MHAYDVLTNLTANHEDTRLIVNRGLTVGEDKTGGLALRGKGDSALLESIDNKEMVRNLCMLGMMLESGTKTLGSIRWIWMMDQLDKYG